MILTTLTALALTVASPQEYCSGWTEGYRSVVGAGGYVPPCPQNSNMANSNQPGSAFQRGLAEGRRAACRAYPQRC